MKETKGSKVLAMIKLSTYIIDIVAVPFQIYYFSLAKDIEYFIEHIGIMILIYVIPFILNMIYIKLDDTLIPDYNNKIWNVLSFIEDVGEGYVMLAIFTLSTLIPVLEVSRILKPLICGIF